MKVVIVLGGTLPCPPVMGGAVEKLWFELAREFGRRGIAVTQISRRWGGLPDEATTDGVAHRRVRGFDAPRSGVWAKVLDLAYSIRCLRALPPADVIVTNTFFLPLLLPWLRRRAVVYVSVHRYPHGQMRFYGSVDRLQCVSTAIADAVRAQAPQVSVRVKVVPNYVSARLSDTQAAAAWPARRREVLFVGRLHPEKGVDLLLAAFAKIAPAARTGWSLRIVGPHAIGSGGGGDAFLAKLQATARALQLPVEWTGPIFDAVALDAAYLESRVFVYPSTAAHGEAFPLAPLEAMAQGCPVVTSDLACFADYVRPGVNADHFELGVDPETALARTLEALMADEPRQRRLADAGLVTAGEFSLSRVAGSFIDDFNALCRP